MLKVAKACMFHWKNRAGPRQFPRTYTSFAECPTHLSDRSKPYSNTIVGHLCNLCFWPSLRTCRRSSFFERHAQPTMLVIGNNRFCRLGKFHWKNRAGARQFPRTYTSFAECPTHLSVRPKPYSNTIVGHLCNLCFWSSLRTCHRSSFFERHAQPTILDSDIDRFCRLGMSRWKNRAGARQYPRTYTSFAGCPTHLSDRPKPNSNTIVGHLCNQCF